MKKNGSIIIISLLIIVIIGLIIYIIKDINYDRELEKNIISQNTIVNMTKTETNDEVIYEIINKKKNLTYSWTFKKDDKYKNSLKDNMEIDLNMGLDILTNIQNETLNNMVTNEDKLVIAFEHHGTLPTSAKIKINVSDKYKDGEKLYLYYLNEEKNIIEYIDNNLPVKNGYVEFEIEHCSNYFLTASIVQDAVGNPKNINLIIIVMVVVIIVLIAATLFQNKK